ncbi:di-heme oxidoredictase family protein [Novipirellula sp. SH528]|uniref:di-heme oxidoredictase family protein n=1 Tax=Novipirellula sp. SH528 TaxID=3454466 RepID=UPI003FA07D8C
MMKRLNRNGITMLFGILAMAAVGVVHCQAVQPESVTQGRVLFEQDWSPRNPITGNDGLGPLFNSTSCVRCHFQGGVGGAGDASVNALTIGIERIHAETDFLGAGELALAVHAAHPGFIQSNGMITNILPLLHHGGSDAYMLKRKELLSHLPVEFSHTGGPMNAAEVRYASSTPIALNRNSGGKRESRGTQVTFNARLFQRNTTALFGAGLIDQVSNRDLAIQAKLQERHPEISGRPSALSDGRFGKFGWRANVGSLAEFIDMACANEVGLNTRRQLQPSDPMNPGYSNPGIDVSDSQIIAMRDFIAALAAPTREAPKSLRHAQQIDRGEKMFASIGCVNCHLQDIGPAKGIYSDLLLHDMGYELMDLSHAEPAIARVVPLSRYELANAKPSKDPLPANYYGASSLIVNSSQTNSEFLFLAPYRPTEPIRIVEVSSQERYIELESGGEESSTDQSEKRKVLVKETKYVRQIFEPTNFNQEWRTPPLWGVRDSAPYMHDGRAETLLEAIAVHEGEASATRDRFLKLPLPDRRAILTFLETLAAPSNVPQPAM